MLIGILITAFGILAGITTIFCIFFQVKNPIKITNKDMVFIVICLILIFLGISNLYYIHIRSDNNVDTNEQSSSIIETESQDTPNNTEVKDDEDTDIDNVDADLSDDEQLIKENFDLIQQLKSEYTDADIKIIENDSVEFDFREIAGYKYSDLLKTHKGEILSGKTISNVKMVILDYNNDNIIYSYFYQNDRIKHFPDNQEKFYCVVFHDDYDIYVSPPIQVIKGDKYSGIDFYLNKKGSEYTRPFQIRLYMREFNSDEEYSLVPKNYFIEYHFYNSNSEPGSVIYGESSNDSGILGGYFSFNCSYVMNVYLYKDSYGEPQLAMQTVSGLVKNSNLIDVYFEIDNE